MKIKIFKNESEYFYNTDYNYDLFVCYFPVLGEPKHNIPILRLITSYDNARKRGYSSYAATNGWSYENFPRIDDNQIEEFYKAYKENKIDFGLIPKKFRNYITDDILSITNTAPECIINLRKSLCDACPLKIDDLCSLCGCGIKNKIKKASEQCPDNPSKWGKYFQTVIKPKLTSAPDFGTRNIIFYCWGKNNKVIDYHLDKLTRVIDIFNGSKILAAVDMDQKYVDKFTAIGFNVIHGANNTNEYPGESSYFHQMLSKLDKQSGVTFYGHAKGVTYQYQDFINTSISKWVDYLYNKCIFSYIDCLNILNDNIFSGAIIRKLNNKFVYPGTYFWFKNKDIFNLNWQTIDSGYGGVEFWPGKITKNSLMGAIDSGVLDGISDFYNNDFFVKKNTSNSSKGCGCKK